MVMKLLVALKNSTFGPIKVEEWNENKQIKKNQKECKEAHHLLCHQSPIEDIYLISQILWHIQRWNLKKVD